MWECWPDLILVTSNGTQISSKMQYIILVYFTEILTSLLKSSCVHEDFPSILHPFESIRSSSNITLDDVYLVSNDAYLFRVKCQGLLYSTTKRCLQTIM